MKFKLSEFDSTFHVDMEAETASEAAMLVRLKMNSKNGGNHHVHTCVGNLTVSSNISIAKKAQRNQRSWIPNAK